jgi:hypothetical protein
LRVQKQTLILYLIFEKGTKIIQWRKNILYNKWCWDKWTPTFERKKKALDVVTHICHPSYSGGRGWFKAIRAKSL